MEYARLAHGEQTRKGTKVTYLAHLLGVASLVLDHGGSEDQAIAALLHDVLEDCGSAHESPIRERFGPVVADIVCACTDGSAESKAQARDDAAKRADWHRRKPEYLSHLWRASDTVLLVSGCDKLHNARAILSDLEDAKVGARVFERFTGGRDGTLAYYHSISETFPRRHVAMSRALEQTVARMHELAGAAARRGLTRAD